jgi:carbon-monoxide dehydrogenase iron sulfur subunit
VICIDISKCTGCRRCEVACTFFHTGRINRHLARIKVLNLYESGIDGPIVCNQCKERYCMCCPADAMIIGSLGQIIISPNMCILCAACEKACPIGAIELFNDFVYVCDLCGGRPKCVDACTEGAIINDEKEKDHPTLAEIKKQTRKMNPIQKRHFYLKKLGAELREKWRNKYA